MHNFHPLEVVGRGSETQLQVGENLTLMSTTVDILRFYWHLYNQLLKVKCALNFETLIIVET